MYLILIVQVPFTFPVVFYETDSVFSEQILKSKYSTIHALGFLPASTIPRDGIHTSERLFRECTEHLVRMHSVKAYVRPYNSVTLQK